MTAVHGALPSWTRRLPAGLPILRAERINDREFARGDFYSEAIRPTGFFHAMITRLERELQPDAFLAFGRRLGCETFSEQELAAVRAFAPHLASAVKLEIRLRAADRRAMDAIVALDALSAGVVVVDAAPRPVLNARARALGACEGVTAITDKRARLGQLNLHSGTMLGIPPKWEGNPSLLHVKLGATRLR